MPPGAGQGAWIALAAVILAAAPSSPAVAQAVPVGEGSDGAARWIPEFFGAVREPVARAPSPAVQDPSPAAAAARSLVLPGWGQLHLQQRRGWGYALVEAALWVAWAERRGRGADLRNQYRDVAWNEGRIQSGPRMDGPFAYYETLSGWTRSGSFDADPADPGVQPEPDPSTFNGSVWALARGLFFAGGTPGPTEPSYQQALSYYEARAYGAAFLWDWTGKETALDDYRRLIRESDDRYRQATAALGAVLANHLLSGIDAFVSARSRLDTRLRVHPDLAGRGGWALTLRLRPER